MPRWLPRVLRRIRELAAAGRVQFTEKARGELADLGADESDATDILAKLGVSEYAGVMGSGLTRERMYVFKPEIAGTILYVKVIVRDVCRVISFHEEDEEDDG